MLIRVQAPRTHLSVMLTTLLSDDRSAPVMSGGAWLTQDLVLPGRTGLLTQVCAGDKDMEHPSACSALASCAGK